jgi:hypothetical protein
MGDGKNTKEDMYDPILAYTHAYGHDIRVFMYGMMAVSWEKIRDAVKLDKFVDANIKISQNTFPQLNITVQYKTYSYTEP